MHFGTNLICPRTSYFKLLNQKSFIFVFRLSYLRRITVISAQNPRSASFLTCSKPSPMSYACVLREATNGELPFQKRVFEFETNPVVRIQCSPIPTSVWPITATLLRTMEYTELTLISKNILGYVIVNSILLITEKQIIFLSKSTHLSIFCSKNLDFAFT